MFSPRTEVGKDPVELSADLMALACRAVNDGGASVEARPYVSLADGESDLRKEFETFSERVYLDGRDDSFDPSLVELSALRVASRALRLAAMAGASR